MDAKIASPHRESRSSTVHRAPTPVGPSRAASPVSHVQSSIGNIGMHRLLTGGVLQAKLTVNRPDDEYERDADRVANQVMRMCADCRGEADEEENGARSASVQAKHARGGAPDVSAELSAYVTGSGHTGQPLPADAREYFEPRFGYDLGHVRVHADTRADAAAREIDALAFAHGPHIHFAQGRFTPGGFEGRRLLAHELAHVLFHQPTTLRRQPYTTKGITLDPVKMESTANASFWEQKTFKAFATSVDPRLSNPEERDAVLSTLWAMSPPTTVTARKVMVVPIAARQGPPAKGSKTPTVVGPSLLYRFTFDPPAKKGALPQLSISFVATGPATTPVVAPGAPASFTPTKPGLRFSGFGSGKNAFDNYFKAHPDEHRDLFHFLETKTSTTFDQVVTTSSVVTRRSGSVTHESVFHVKGDRAGSTLSNLEIHLVSEGPVEAEQKVDPDYQSHDRVDLEIERLQARSKAADRLGSVTLPPKLPREERQAVKYAIWQYFDSGNARNTEVDAIVPVGSPAGGRRILYTLEFSAGNDVTVTRIGEAGAGAGKVDAQRIDVTRVRGFPGATAAPAKLQSWWTKRYPKGGTLTSTAGGTSPTSATLIADMNRLMTAGIAKATWFKDNYGVDVLDAAGTATRLQKTHGAPEPMTRDTVNFSAADLRGLELSFQTLGDSEITNLKDVRIGRKHRAIDRQTVKGKTVFVAGGATTAGVTFSDSSGSTRDTTILYFDRYTLGDDALFTGSSAASALPGSTLTFLHELGHALEPVAGTKAAFDKWLKKNPQVPLTWYAASAGSEVFPEAYALYHGDPHFLCNAAPDLFAWLDELAKTGTPPAAGATLTPPAKCP